MYGSQAREPVQAPLYGTYNLYLGMYDWLKVMNISDTTLSGSLYVYTAGSGTHEVSVSIAPRASVDLGLHEFDVYGTTANSYGVIEIAPSGSNKIFGELLRLKPGEISGAVDFAAPTEVR